MARLSSACKNRWLPSYTSHQGPCKIFLQSHHSSSTPERHCSGRHPTSGLNANPSRGMALLSAAWHVRFGEPQYNSTTHVFSKRVSKKQLSARGLQSTCLSSVRKMHQYWLGQALCRRLGQWSESNDCTWQCSKESFSASAGGRCHAGLHVTIATATVAESLAQRLPAFWTRWSPAPDASETCISATSYSATCSRACGSLQPSTRTIVEQLKSRALGKNQHDVVETMNQEVLKRCRIWRNTGGQNMTYSWAHRFGWVIEKLRKFSEGTT